MTSLFHELRNQLAVANANVEAILDGTLPSSPERLRTVLHALEAMDVLIAELQAREHEPPACGSAR